MEASEEFIRGRRVERWCSALLCHFSSYEWKAPVSLDVQSLMWQLQLQNSFTSLTFYLLCKAVHFFTRSIYIMHAVDVLRQICQRARPTPLLRGSPFLIEGVRPSRMGRQQLAEGPSSFSRPVTCGQTSARRPSSKCRRLASLCRHSLGMYR